MEVIREIAGETLAFLPQKAIYWPRRKSLIVADLHWGKAETFQKAGIPVSSEILLDDLARLGALIREKGAAQVLLLGDLLHGKKGLTPELRSIVSEWRRQFSAAFILVEGNHDKHVKALPPEWNLEIKADDAHRDAPFTFAHHPPHKKGGFTWCGHLHPMLSMGRRGDSLRLPCFWLRPHYGVLPSFGSFTGGMNIDRAEDDEVLLVAESEVLPL